MENRDGTEWDDLSKNFMDMLKASIWRLARRTVQDLQEHYQGQYQWMVLL